MVDILDIHDPSEFEGKTYFLFECLGTQNASFNILSDGKGYAVVTRTGDRKITKNFRPAPSVDLSSLNVIDQLVITKAIEKFFE